MGGHRERTQMWEQNVDLWHCSQTLSIKWSHIDHVTIFHVSTSFHHSYCRGMGSVSSITDGSGVKRDRDSFHVIVDQEKLSRKKPGIWGFFVTLKTLNPMVRFSPWPTLLRLFRSFCCSEISTSSASLVMSNTYCNHVWNPVSTFCCLAGEGEGRARVPAGSAGRSAGGSNTRRSGSAGGPRSWSSCQSARPHARSCERSSRMCWWGGRRPLLWRTCTSLWTTSCGGEDETSLFF